MELISLLGGYDSWGFAVCSIGGVIVGGILIPLQSVRGLIIGSLVYFFGGGLLFSMMVDDAAKALGSGGVEPSLEGAVEAVPIFFLAILLIGAVKLASENKWFKRFEHNNG